MKLGGEWAKWKSHKLHILSSWLIFFSINHIHCFWGSLLWIFWIVWFFLRKYKYRCIRVYVWFKDDKHVIWMWIWLMLKNISLLDRIWSLWLVRFAHSPPNFWIGVKQQSLTH
jgi:hypothetical protein